jgi:hypothetical protein
MQGGELLQRGVSEGALADAPRIVRRGGAEAHRAAGGDRDG